MSMTKEREAEIRDYTKTSRTTFFRGMLEVLLAELDETRAQAAELEKRHHANLLRWEVVEREFVTTREKQRDTNTKVWIQSDLKCREYANKLEKELLETKAQAAVQRQALEYYRDAKAYDNVVGELLVAERCFADKALALGAGSEMLAELEELRSCAIEGNSEIETISKQHDNLAKMNSDGCDLLAKAYRERDELRAECELLKLKVRMMIGNQTHEEVKHRLAKSEAECAELNEIVAKIREAIDAKSESVLVDIERMKDHLTLAELSLNGFTNNCIKPECECWACLYFKERDAAKEGKT